jgi:hypothetical protein
MRGITRAPSLVAAVVGAIAIALTQPPIAEAAASALTDHTITVKSGHLRVFAADVQSNISTGVALSTTISNNTSKNFFVNNGGTLTVSRFTMTITLPNNSNVSTFRRCAVNVAFTGPGVWFRAHKLLTPCHYLEMVSMPSKSIKTRLERWE